MVLTLNNLAEKYKCLPSEAFAKANTLDIYVLDVSTKYVKYQNDLAEGKQPVKKSAVPSQEEMIQMIKRVRGEQ